MPARYVDRPALTLRVRAVLFAVIVAMHGAIAVFLLGALAQRQGAVPSRMPLSARLIIAPPAPATHQHREEGAGGANGKRAHANQIVGLTRFPMLQIPIAAPLAGLGSDARSGANTVGEAGGSGTAGSGSGSGAGGQGDGGRFVATKPAKIAGNLAETDYARAGRIKRLGSAVVVVLTVGTDGHVSACRVHQSSGDPDADAVTCRLALERFRFHPALDQHGDPIEATFGWQQRFFAP